MTERLKVSVGHLSPVTLSRHVFERAGPVSTSVCINVMKDTKQYSDILNHNVTSAAH